ncbi:MAG: DUF2975 domain-containing protein [Bacteroidota bacterium]
MENRKLLAIIRSVINLFWILQWVLIFALITYTSLLVLNVDFFDVDVLKGFKIHFSKIEFIQPLIFEGSEYSFNLTNGVGRLHVSDLPRNFIYYRLFAAFVDTFLYLSILYFLRKIFINLTDNEYFIPENGMYLKKIGYTIIALALLPEIIHYLSDLQVVKYITIENVKLKTEFNFDIQTILLGILVFVISLVFLRGIELKKDQELTI